MKNLEIKQAAALFTLAMAVPLPAAVDNLRILGKTETQVVVAYTAPDTGPCSVAVSLSASFTPLVHDVNPAYYSGADTDLSRGGTIVLGRERAVVIGQRVVETATDGIKRSRALEAARVHYVQVTCGADTATASFQTENIPLGRTRGEALRADPAKSFSYLQPSTNAFYQDHFNDPLTGVAHQNSNSVFGWTYAGTTGSSGT